MYLGCPGRESGKIYKTILVGPFLFVLGTTLSFENTRAINLPFVSYKNAPSVNYM